MTINSELEQDLKTMKKFAVRVYQRMLNKPRSESLTFDQDKLFTAVYKVIANTNYVLEGRK
jgi:hypothetical protein